MNDEWDTFEERKRKALQERGELLDLSMINPDLAPPRVLVDRLFEASSKTYNHRYSVSRGVRKLREGFATKYEHAFSVALDPEEEVCITFGSKDAIFELLRGVSVEGGWILAGTPLYPGFQFAAEECGLRIETFEVSVDEASMLTQIREKIAQGGCSVIVLNFPHNPTGLLVSSSFLKEVITIGREHQVLVYNDFVYGEMGYEKQPVSLLSCTESNEGVVESYSLSKAYSIPGWRVGALVGDKKVISLVAKAKSRLDYGLFLPLQYAAAFALQAAESLTGAVVSEYKWRAKVVSALLRKYQWQVTEPQAGCSVWAIAPSMPSQAVDWLDAFLQEGICVTPGEAFGAQWHTAVRFALVAPEEKLRRLERVLETQSVYDSKTYPSSCPSAA